MKYFLSVLIFITTLNASSLYDSISSLNNDEIDIFILGKSFFRVPWVEAPSATTARDGLGPLFSANTCTSCHPQNAKGSLYDSKGNISRSLVTRLSIKSKKIDSKVGYIPEPTYGSQLSINAIYGVPYEGKSTRSYIDKIVVLNGGRKVTLHQPIYGITNLGYGALDGDVVISQRIPPALFGLGLLEQISDKQLLANEDIDDKNLDGISGKANRVYSPTTSKIEIGRYNCKANASKVKDQVAGAMSNDMGLTSPLYPDESCTDAQKKCKDSPKGRDSFDVPMKRLDAVTFYLKNLKLSKNKKDKEYKNGLMIFKHLGCASCHIPTFTLDSGEKIYPFSDLLLHDMGEGLADGRVEFRATGSEFKTPPLWGISAYKKILKNRVNFLHDGRAGTIEEAILWHDGEAKHSKSNFIRLRDEKRKMLIDFLEKL